MEPPLKKMKHTNVIVDAIEKCLDELEVCTSIKAVLGDEFDQELPLRTVFVGTVTDTKLLSKIILTLNEKLSLKNLNHLKRVRSKSVIICPVECLIEFNCSSIEELIAVNVPDLKDCFECYSQVEVPARAPKVKKQIEQSLWSINFHPNKYLESLSGDNFFSNDEVKQHVTLMQVVFESTRWFLQEEPKGYQDLKDVNATVVFDPSCFKVVAVSFLNNDHPIQHSAMMAIDSVAKTQNGGAWGQCPNKTNYTLAGIDPELLAHLREKFPNLQYGARQFSSKRDFVESLEDDIYVSDSPYLCTRYYMYMLKEPCVMCSMGLVHARVKRIFYCFDNKDAGGLKSKMKLQAVASLNHHFEVFTGFIKTDIF